MTPQEGHLAGLPAAGDATMQKTPGSRRGFLFQLDAGQRPALPAQAATVLATSWYSSIWSKFM